MNLINLMSIICIAIIGFFVGFYAVRFEDRKKEGRAEAKKRRS